MTWIIYIKATERKSHWANVVLLLCHVVSDGWNAVFDSTRELHSTGSYCKAFEWLVALPKAVLEALGIFHSYTTYKYMTQSQTFGFELVIDVL